MNGTYFELKNEGSRRHECTGEKWHKNHQWQLKEVFDKKEPCRTLFSLFWATGEEVGEK